VSVLSVPALNLSCTTVDGKVTTGAAVAEGALKAVGSTAGAAGTVGVLVGAEGVTAGVAGTVGVLVGAEGVTAGADAAQPGMVKVLVSSDTCPFLAIALPWTIVPVVAVIEVSAMMLPLNVESVPRVAELPTCQ
jgi:hypothetical protein